MTGYYDEKLAAERLRRCYELAPPAARRYLQAEIDHVAARVRPGDRVLELGCGYGRALAPVVPLAGEAWGIDTSLASLRLARRTLPAACRLARMDATRLALADCAFDLVFCIQNGVSAFHADPLDLAREALRVARPGGRVLLSSYAESFWEDRLAWFRVQAEHGLLGTIDEDATGGGVIVCKDGFRATTFGLADFGRLAAALGRDCDLEEVAGASLFCTLRA
ncbi:MAG: class I SAM-dependent methyltransferase [Candidatus Krumholzibacteriota bacterium]|nr:class I SAM-dependent methyltransferase [Candidatus Krumholzibacteriota bacterium]